MNYSKESASLKSSVDCKHYIFNNFFWKLIGYDLSFMMFDRLHFFSSSNDLLSYSSRSLSYKLNFNDLFCRSKEIG